MTSSRSFIRRVSITRLLTHAAILASLFALGTELQASPALHFIAPTGTAPWILRDSKGEVSGGILFELVKHLEKISKRSITIETSTYARIDQRLSEGEFDLAFYSADQAHPHVIPIPYAVIVDDFGVIFLTANTSMKDCHKIRTVAHTNMKSDALVQILESQCGKKSIINTNGLNHIPCGKVSFHKLLSIKVHILLHEDSILNQEPYREELIKFSKTFYPETYNQIRKNVLGKKYCPEHNTKGI
ncbi:MAG TPA: hypothetical protein VE954_18050 [Oligoflexus sp.]|uniref:hypothetical protein n=1 Tax=Oligoflexus sp. TaxID=1971216 RepID=UPI002D3CD876|nr:hypothetical protein [Oligoflexus sp.]HYX35003.1 hypothetical protein [Oligoflexus sp.]